MSMNMKGTTALITGGAHGIGFGIASNLASQGATVVIADINGERGQEAVEKLEKLHPGVKVNFQTCDVSSWASQVAAFAGARKFSGQDRIDVVFANAGIAQYPKDCFDPSCQPSSSSEAQHYLSTLADNPPSMRVIDVNLTGALYTIYLAMTHFRTQEKDSDGMRGKLIVTGSNAMIYPFPADVLYGSAKTGLLGTVRSLAPRFALEGMTVNALAPALVQTGLPLPPNSEELGIITPMKTITNACEMFYKAGSEVNGHIAECCVDRVVLRKFPQPLDKKAYLSMNQFWSQEAISACLDDFKGHESS